ncbi:hypothetical protein [Paucilactobacillus sp. N302-9]
MGKTNSFIRFSLWILLITLVVISPQLYNHSLILGGDSLFHMNRFYDTAMQIKTGNFNYFQSNYGFNQSGRIINALYGPVVAYLNGGLLWILRSWFKFQIISSILVYYIAGISMYSLLKSAKLPEWESRIGSILYLLTPIITSWGTNQNFNAFGAALMPLIFIPAFRMLSDNSQLIPSYIFAAFVSLLIQTHILSAIIGISALVPFVIAGLYFRKNKLSFFLYLLKAVLLTCLLTLNITIVMLNLMKKNNLMITFPNKVMDVTAMKFSMGLSGFSDFGFWFSLLFIIIIVLVFILWKQLTFELKLVFTVGFFYLWISSTLFPWRIVENRIQSLQSYLQYPQRFAVISYVLIIFGLFYLISENEKLKKENHFFEKIAVIILSCFTVGAIFSENENYRVESSYWMSKRVVTKNAGNAVQINSNNPNKIRTAFFSPQLNKGLKFLEKPTPDYLPTNKKVTIATYDKFNPYGKYSKQILNNKAKFRKTVLKNAIEISWTGTSKQTVPVIIYHNTNVKLNGKNVKNSQLHLTSIGSPQISGDKNKNMIVLKFRTPQVIKYAIIVSFLSWFFIVILIFIYLVKLMSIHKKAILRNY